MNETYRIRGHIDNTVLWSEVPWLRKDQGRMDREHEGHLQRLQTWAYNKIERKYRKGQKEHGGKLWEENGLLKEMHNEALDQIAYGQALEEHCLGILEEYDRSRLSADETVVRLREALFGDRYSD